MYIISKVEDVNTADALMQFGEIYKLEMCSTFQNQLATIVRCLENLKDLRSDNTGSAIVSDSEILSAKATINDILNLA
jgi:hypothetical protein